MSDNFYTKLAGVSKKNEDGRHRQEVIEEDLYEGLDLYLEREPDNAYDSNAVAVFTSAYGDQVGYLNGKVAEEIAPLMDRGQLVTCQVSEITGDYDQTRGVNVLITKYTPNKTRELAEASKARKPVDEAPKPQPEATKPSPAGWTETNELPGVKNYVSPGESSASTSGKPTLKQRWKSLPKKTRTWIIVIAVVILIYFLS